MRVYLDNAATTPVAEEVIEVMTQALREQFGNPSSIHAEGRSARAAIEQARKLVAHYLGASIGEIFFTSCGTESNNMILKNAVRDLGVRRILSTRTEHHCVLHSLDSLSRNEQVEVVYIHQDARGRIDLGHLRELLGASSVKTMVSLMHANNEIGTMIDLDEVGALCRGYGALFHSDTVQTVGYFPIDVSKTPVQFLSGSAHKFHGPKGAGFVYINNENHLRPFIDGGSQERNMRGGTENLHGILGLARALQLSCDHMAERREHIAGLRRYLAEQLQANFADLHFNGDWDGNAHYKLLSVAFPASLKADLLLLNLDIAGVAVSGGSACSSGADAGSHVLDALQADPDRRTIRFSFSYRNTREEIDFAMEKLRGILC